MQEVYNIPKYVSEDNKGVLCNPIIQQKTKQKQKMGPISSLLIPLRDNSRDLTPSKYIVIKVQFFK